MGSGDSSPPVTSSVTSLLSCGLYACRMTSCCGGACGSQCVTEINAAGTGNRMWRHQTASGAQIAPSSSTKRTPTNIIRSLSNLVYMYMLPLQTLLQIFESIDWKPDFLRIFNFRLLKFSTSKLWHLESSSWCHLEALNQFYKIHLEVKYHTNSISRVIAISIFYI